MPRLRRHLVTYHGVLAPAAGLRSFAVPRVKAEPDAGCRHAPGEEVAAEEDGGAAARKYELDAPIGMGGIGVVQRGRDSDLNREVAVRFVEEAQIGGQLQHPGIVPVYELGMADGKPFFAMKLIVGETWHARLQARATPRDDLPARLGVFRQVCQTMAHARRRAGRRDDGACPVEWTAA